jgi:gamma-glutamyltranspeptidase/glutathione hydrolase
MYLDGKGNVRGGESLTTHKAAGVPGTVAGLWLAHQKWGSMPWKDLVAPAIALAEGWDMDDWTARSLAANAGAHTSFKKYFGGGGTRLVQADLAATLRRIAEKGRDGFYTGETAKLIAAEMKRGNGLISEEDLAKYEAKLRTPASGTYRGHRIVSMPPPSSGGAILVLMLNMLEGFEPAKLGHNSAAYVHLVAEIEKRAFADRSVWLGDSDFFDVPLDGLVAKSYATSRIGGFDAAKRTDPAAVKEGAPRGRREKEETTHFSVVDRKGNAVSLTTTLNDGYGSKIVVDGAGFLLNNEMDDFSLKPGVPNMYGVIGAEANAIAPGKRMLSSMSPTLVFTPDGKLWLVLGTPGGPTIFTTVFQVIVNRLDFGMPLDKAVGAARFHHQWPPPSKDRDPIRHEGLSDDVAAELRKLGYALDRRRIGDVHAVEIDRAAKRALGASDPRGIGKAE